jgi:uncharacterized protein YukE
MADVTVNYEALSRVAAELQAGRENLQEQLERLQRLIDDLVKSEFRTRIASVQFDASYRQWTASAQGVLENLQSFMGFLQQALQAHQDLDAKLASGASSGAGGSTGPGTAAEAGAAGGAVAGGAAAVGAAAKLRGGGASGGGSGGGPSGGAAPLPQARTPNARHNLTRVTTRTTKKAKNTVIGPDVDVNADVEAIRAGNYTRQGNDIVVNGRTYQMESSGTLFPVSGPGFYPLDRMSFMALGILNEEGGLTAAAVQKLAVYRDMTPENIQAAVEAWRAANGGGG